MPGMAGLRWCRWFGLGKLSGAGAGGEGSGESRALRHRQARRGKTGGPAATAPFPRSAILQADYTLPAPFTSTEEIRSMTRTLRLLLALVVLAALCSPPLAATCGGGGGGGMGGMRRGGGGPAMGTDAL